MYIDSHCHLQTINLEEFNNNLDNVIQIANNASVTHMLSVCVDLDDIDALNNIGKRFDNVYTSVGIHPTVDSPIIESFELVKLADNPWCIAIGETGLDYYRITEDHQKTYQQTQFRNHIKAARECKKPLIIHTRDARTDTIKILQEENANDIGGVFHCFTEDWEMAKKGLDLNFYISFSGILTFKNATILQEVAKKVPMDRILIETDAPYLAPVPYRGKPNQPAWVVEVAKFLSQLRNIPLEEVAATTTNNFFQCFKLSQS